jgi:hypothetical protein
MAKKYLDLNGLAYFASKIKRDGQIDEVWRVLAGEPIGNFSGRLGGTATVLMKYINGIICLAVSLGMFDSSTATTQPGVVVPLSDLVENPIATLQVWGIRFTDVDFGNAGGRSCGVVVSAKGAIFNCIASSDAIIFSKISGGASGDSISALITFPYINDDAILLPDIDADMELGQGLGQ